MNVERRLRELGIELPDFGDETYYGTTTYGSMKPFHIIGNVLHLSGHVPERDGKVVYPGRLGETVTLEQGIEAARITGINAMAGMKQALGDLDRVVGIIKSLNFVACAPDFHLVHKVSSGMTDLLAEVFGRDIGIGCRATIGIQALALNNCFETWMEVEFR
jgi:enamine deaminase RidA (YjgF/YER057c/UK114 family)